MFTESLKYLKIKCIMLEVHKNNDVRHIQNHIGRLRRYSLFTSTWYIHNITTHRYFITVETEDLLSFAIRIIPLRTICHYRTPRRLNFQFTSL